LVPIVSGAALLVANSYGFWSESVSALRDAASKRSAGFEAGCVGVGDPNFFVKGRGECTWGEARAGAPIYLTGDSLADQLSDGLLVAGRELNRPVHEITFGSCPFVRDVVSTGGRYQSDNCRNFVREVLGWLDGQPAGTVIVSLSPKYWIGGHSTDTLEVDPLASELGEIAEQMSGSGHEILFVRPTPVWINDYPFVPERCSLRAILSAKCQQSVPQAMAQEEQRFLWDAMKLAAARTETKVWNSWNHVCLDGVCATHDGDIVRYRDETHISLAQSLKLADALADALESDHGRTRRAGKDGE